MAKDIIIDFDEFVNVFNIDGKEKAKAFADAKYNRSYEYVQRKLHKESEYYFDRSEKRYKKKNERIVDAAFMSIDDLYKGKNLTIESKPEGLVKQALQVDFEDIVMGLIKDRLTELSKYILLDHGANKLLVKASAIKEDGFELILT
jgi:hypothetical protein